MTPTERIQAETVVHVLANGKACPVYSMPCWCCLAMTSLTLVCRGVTAGRWDLFERVSVRWWTEGDYYSERGALLISCLHIRRFEPGFAQRTDEAMRELTA